MGSPRTGRELEIGMRFLSWMLVEIRAAAFRGDADRARRLADAVHNLPTDLLRHDLVIALADVRERCADHGDLETFEVALQNAGGEAMRFGDG